MSDTPSPARKDTIAASVMPSGEAPKSAGRGRPRDPSLEARVFEIAVRLYAEAGWGGFNFEQIAKQAGVGKAALYNRWRTREALFSDAFAHRWQAIETIETGSLTTDLDRLAELTMERTLAVSGGVFINIQSDGRRFPEFRAIAAPFYQERAQGTRQILLNAIARGELSAAIPMEDAQIFIHGCMTGRIANWQLFDITPDAETLTSFRATLTRFLIQGLKAFD